MLRIARQTDYAARLVLHLASLGEGASASIADIAHHRLLPVPFVRRMVARMVGAGLLRTTRGARGGVQLARSPAAISLGDVVQAMEGPISLNDCVRVPRTCPLVRRCPVQKVWTEVSDALAGQLASVRFDVLAAAADGHASAHLRLEPRPAPRPGKPRSP